MKIRQHAKHYWCPVAPDGYICKDILAEKRGNAVHSLMMKPWRETRGKTWDELRREGWRCIKVKIVPVEG